jgi:hypothetical protein
MTERDQVSCDNVANAFQRGRGRRAAPASGLDLNLLTQVLREKNPSIPCNSRIDAELSSTPSLPLRAMRPFLRASAPGTKMLTAEALVHRRLFALPDLRATLPSFA